jgi:hypothetical protein
MEDGPQKGLSFSPKETEQASAPVDSKNSLELSPASATISDASKNRLLRALAPETEVNRGYSAKPYKLAQRGNNFKHPVNSYKSREMVDD